MSGSGAQGSTPRFTLRRRLQLLVLGVSVALLGVIVAMTSTLAAFRDDAARRDHLSEVAVDATKLTTLLAAPSTSFDAATLNAAYVVLVRASSGETELRAPVQRLGTAIAAFNAAREIPADGRAANALAAPRMAVADAVRAVTTKLSTLTGSAIARASTSRRNFLGAVAAATITAVLLLLAGSRALRRWVVVPVEQLHADIDAIGEGDLYRVVRPTGSRDLVELAAAVDRMRTRILGQRDVAERAEEAIEQEFPAVAALRHLLAASEDDGVERLDVAAALFPAEGVLAGDWYDLVRVDDRLVVTIGDVCGHGATTGISAVRTKFALLDAVDLGHDPATCLALAARRFGHESEFVTAVVASIDPVGGACVYGNAGHPPPIVVRGSGDVETLEPTGPLIGPFNNTWETASMQIGAGDTLVLFSDGLIEARDATGESLGTEAIERAVAVTSSGSAVRTLQEIVAALFRHCPDGLYDDVTIVVVRVGE